jgi:hypothetical protein
MRKELRKTAAKLEENMRERIDQMYEKPVDEWDWEELSKGQPRLEDGSFPKGRPKWITPAIQAEVQRRMRALSEQELMTHARQAIITLSDLMTDNDYDDFGKPVVPASVKLQSAQYILNHVIGTPKARVEMSQSNPLVELMGGILVNPDGEPSHQIIEGEVVEDDGGE